MPPALPVVPRDSVRVLLTLDESTFEGGTMGPRWAAAGDASGSTP